MRVSVSVKIIQNISTLFWYSKNILYDVWIPHVKYHKLGIAYILDIPLIDIYK